LKEFKKFSTFSFERVLLKLCRGFEIVFPLLGIF
jgi:hypothetical protein